MRITITDTPEMNGVYIFDTVAEVNEFVNKMDKAHCFSNFIDNDPVFDVIDETGTFNV